MSSPHTPPSAPSAACLQPSTAIDSDHPSVVAFAREHATGQTERERAVSLYLAVRDRLRYDPYRIDLSPAGMRASTALLQGFGWCVPKAVALAAVARAAGIPARLGFADVRNHLSTERLRQTMKTDVFVADYVKNVYLIDVAVVGGFYPEWTTIGRGIVDYISVPDIPVDGRNTQIALPGGHIAGGDLATFKEIKKHDDAYFRDGVTESVKHSCYEGGKGPLHPYKGETRPQYTDFQEDGKYSWLKSPTFYEKPMQDGPLPRVLAMVAAGHQPTIDYATHALDLVSTVAKTKVGLDALHSNIGRHAARAVACAVEVDELAFEGGSAFLLGEDGCAAFSPEVHRTAIDALRPVGRVATIAEMIAEIAGR